MCMDFFVLVGSSGFMYVRGIFVFIFVALPILLLFGFFVSGRETLVICDVQIQHAEPNILSLRICTNKFPEEFRTKSVKSWTKWKNGVVAQMVPNADNSLMLSHPPLSV